MIRVIAADEEEKKEPNEKEPKVDKSKDKPKADKQKAEPKEKPDNYFKVNPNFKFEAIVDNFPVKELTIKEAGKKGLLNFLKQVFIELKNRKAPTIVARMEGSLLSVNPVAPIERQSTSNITPRGYILGILAEFKKLGIKCSEFLSLYDYSKGKLNSTVSEILERKITTSNYDISEIEGVKKLSEVIPVLNADKRLQKEMDKILLNYNKYASMYYSYLVRIVNSKLKG